MQLCAFYAAHGWDMDALDKVADATPLQRMFLDHAQEQYWLTLRNVIASAISMAMGGDNRNGESSIGHPELT